MHLNGQASKVILFNVQANPVKTGAQAREVGRLEVGRLSLPERKKQPTGQVRKKSFAVEATYEEPTSQQVEELEEFTHQFITVTITITITITITSHQVGELEEFTHQFITVKPNVIDWKELRISRVKISFAKFVLDEREDKRDDKREDKREDEETTASDEDSESELFEV